MASKKRLSEDLKRFNNIIGYNPSKGVKLNEKREPWQNTIMEDETEDDTQDGNDDFDFGDEGSPEKGGGDEGGDFEFGGSEDNESGEDLNIEDEGTEEDEFGTASEFSAVDDIETLEDDVEEIDVTDIVTRSEEAKEMAQQAVSVGQQNGEYLKSLTDKLANLESQLTVMDTIASKIGKLEQNIKSPEEKLELRSLDSYPFNQKLSDYWEEKATQNDNYSISTGESTTDGETKEYTLKPGDIDDYNDVDIKNSFNPDSNGETDVYKRQY